MFSYIKYRLKIFLKNKTMVFWTLVFPIALTTMFYFVFSDMQFDTPLEPFQIAVVDNGNENMKQLLTQLSDKESDNYLFDVEYTQLEEGRDLLRNQEVSVIVVLDDVPKMESISYDHDTTIMKSILNTYQRVYNQINHIAQENPQAMADIVIEDLLSANVEIHALNSGGSEKDMNMTYFYTALGMTCMYGAIWGCVVSSDLQANQTKRAARVNIAPVSKRKLLLVDYVLAYLFIVLETMILFCYMKFILGVEFGEQIGLVIGVCLAGILAMLSLGILIGTSKLEWQSKIGLVSSGTVCLNFFAGMMGSGMPYMISQVAPFMKYINPADLISRAFSMIYYYEDLSPVYLNIVILIGMAIIFTLFAYLRMRRESYASI